MSPLVYGLVFGGICWAAAVIICVACLRAFAQENAAWENHYAGRREEGL